MLLRILGPAGSPDFPAWLTAGSGQRLPVVGGGLQGGATEVTVGSTEVPLEGHLMVARLERGTSRARKEALCRVRVERERLWLQKLLPELAPWRLCGPEAPAWRPLSWEA